MKIRKNPGKIRKPEKNPEKNIIISYLLSKPSIMWRNAVKNSLWEHSRYITKAWPIARSPIARSPIWVAIFISRLRGDRRSSFQKMIARWLRSRNLMIAILQSRDYFFKQEWKKLIPKHWVCNVFHVFRIKKGNGNACFIRKSRIISYITPFFSNYYQ